MLLKAFFALALAFAPLGAAAQGVGNMLGVGGVRAAGGGGLTAQWSTTDKSASVTISTTNATNDTAAYAGTGGLGSVRSVTSHSSGKFGFAYQWISTGGASAAEGEIGIALGSDSLANLGSAAGAYVYFKDQGNSDGNVYHNGSAVGAAGATNTVDRHLVMVDLVNNKIWFYNATSGQWNNNGTDNPATNTGGISIAAGTYFAGFTATTNSAGIIIDWTTTTGFPSGFSAWQ